MPRPKRTKVASAVVIPTRVEKPTTRQRSQQKPTRQQNPAESTSISDDSDGLVVKARVTRNAPQMKDVDVTMTGGIPAGGRTRGRKEKSDVRVSNATVASKASLTPSTNASKKSRTSAAGAKAIDATPLHARGGILGLQDIRAQDDESSLLDPSLLTFGSLDSESPAAHGTRPPSAIKVGATPGHETSILALTNFKRRARQPSLLRMVNQTTDVEDNDVNDFDDLDDFAPDAESTPVNLRTAAAHTSHEKTGLSLSSSGSRGKKRKISPVVQVPRSSPPCDSPSGDVIETSQRSSSPSLPEVIHSTEEITETQDQPINDILSETMAPPRSSSAPVAEISDSPERTKTRTRGRTRGRPRNSDPNDSAHSDPELTAKSKPRQRNSRTQTISTAKLQALLPRRRTRPQRQHDEYEITSSDPVDVTSIASSEDELQVPRSRLAARARKTAAPKPKADKAKSVKKMTMLREAAKKHSRPSRTYGRTSSDKENESATIGQDGDEGDVEEITETSITFPQSKLQAIAKKFEDVDAWEMEFESVDMGGESSSPWR